MYEDLGNRIFIGGLDVKTTEATLNDAFQMFGEIQQVLVMRHRETDIPRGFGFISFVNPDSAHEAISRMHGVEILGKCVTVRKAEKQGNVTEGPRRGGYRGRGAERGRSNRFDNDRRPYNSNHDERRGFNDPRSRYDSGYSRGGYQGSKNNRERGGFHRSRDGFEGPRENTSRDGHYRDDTRRRSTHEDQRDNRPKVYERENIRESYSRRDNDLIERPNFESSRPRRIGNDYQSSRTFRNQEMDVDRSNEKKVYRERDHMTENENNGRRLYKDRNRSNDYDTDDFAIRGREIMNDGTSRDGDQSRNSALISLNKRFSSRPNYERERSRSPLVERYSTRQSSPPPSRYSKQMAEDSPPNHYMREKRDHQPEKRSHRESSRGMPLSFGHLESSPPPGRRMDRRSSPNQFQSEYRVSAMIRNSSSSPKRINRDSRIADGARPSRMHIRSEQTGRNMSPDVATSHRSRETHAKSRSDVAFNNFDRSVSGSRGYSERPGYPSGGQSSRYQTGSERFSPPVRGISSQFSSGHESKRLRRQISPQHLHGSSKVY